MEDKSEQGRAIVEKVCNNKEVFQLISLNLYACITSYKSVPTSLTDLLTLPSRKLCLHSADSEYTEKVHSRPVGFKRSML